MSRPVRSRLRALLTALVVVMVTPLAAGAQEGGVFGGLANFECGDERLTVVPDLFPEDFAEFDRVEVRVDGQVVNSEDGATTDGIFETLIRLGDGEWPVEAVGVHDDPTPEEVLFTDTVTVDGCPPVVDVSVDCTVINGPSVDVVVSGIPSEAFAVSATIGGARIAKPPVLPATFLGGSPDGGLQEGVATPVVVTVETDERTDVLLETEVVPDCEPSAPAPPPPPPPASVDLSASAACDVDAPAVQFLVTITQGAVETIDAVTVTFTDGDGATVATETVSSSGLYVVTLPDGSGDVTATTDTGASATVTLPDDCAPEQTEVLGEETEADPEPSPDPEPETEVLQEEVEEPATLPDTGVPASTLLLLGVGLTLMGGAGTVAVRRREDG